MKLHQIVALVSGKKERASKALTQAHHGWNKAAIVGQSRIYTPLNPGDSDVVPNETVLIQARVQDGINIVRESLADFWDLAASQENSNCFALGDVVVGGHTILNNVPVTALLMLEKQLTDLRTFVEGIPTLSPERRWSWSSEQNCYVSDPVEQVRTRKVQTPLVLYPATVEHPAQTQIISEDRVVGRYVTTQYSGAMKAEEKAGIVKRVDQLRDAVKSARELANSIDAKALEVSEAVFDFVFGS